MLKNFGELLKAVASEPARKIAVAAANDKTLVAALKQAIDEDVAIPVLVGDKKMISGFASELGWSLADGQIVDSPNEISAAREATRLVREGRCEILMKGQIHTDDFLRAVLDKEAGLRTGAAMSHVFILELPAQERLLFVTDGAMNIAPDLVRKSEIILNAVSLANAFGFEKPTVAVVAAVELVNPAMPATLDAAALAKMSDRGQFPNCIVDGPFGFDNAVSVAAARQKKISSPVAGKADILLAPNIEAGNMLVKCFSHLCGGTTAGVLVGASVPVVLTSRADNAEAKFLSIAAAALMVNMSRSGNLKVGKVHY
ncbi:MAG: bifunctional enoyl-CoA hydratase/phosphate acetyltransferase [Armatimonadota bacterium]|nr:bifunctional enoyl-CoA hydratase/phosphate acetyltransferase [Armatimonadota bacterium]